MAKQFPPLALLLGDDEFSIAEQTRKYREALDPASADFNLSEFDGQRASLSDVRASSDAFPFMGARRLVIVYGLLTRLTAKGAAKSLKAQIDQWIDYFPTLPETTCLLLVETKPISERSRLVKAIEAIEGAHVRQYTIPAGARLITWIEKRAKMLGGTFTQGGAQALAAAVGDEPRAIASEIEKLLTYVDFARPVTQADVERLTPASGQATVWEMVDALGQRDGRGAMRALHDLLEQPGQEPMAIFGMVVRQFRLLIQAKEVINDGGNADAIARQLDAHPFVARKLYGQARHYSLSMLESIYRRLLALDADMKLSKIDSALALDLLIAGLTM